MGREKRIEELARRAKEEQTMSFLEDKEMTTLGKAMKLKDEDRKPISSTISGTPWDPRA